MPDAHICQDFCCLGPYLGRLPTEVRFEIWVQVLLAKASPIDGVDKDKKKVQVVARQVTVNSYGKPAHLYSSILYISRLISQEVYTCAWNTCVFKFQNPDHLANFLQNYARRLEHHKRPIYIVIALFQPLMFTAVHSEFASFGLCNGAHCPQAAPLVRQWFQLLGSIPRNPIIFLQYKLVWRDFEQLRNIAVDNGIPTKSVYINYIDVCPIKRSDKPNRRYGLVRQERRAIFGKPFKTESSDWYLQMLIEHGCTGISLKDPPHSQASDSDSGSD